MTPINTILQSKTYDVHWNSNYRVGCRPEQEEALIFIQIFSEPIIISLPEMEPERFYHFQLIDLYTHNFAYLGTLATGNKAGKYLIANQSWKGEKPEGIDAVIRSETDIFFVIVRTQLMNENDLEEVKRIQAEYQTQALSA